MTFRGLVNSGQSLLVFKYDMSNRLQKAIQTMEIKNSLMNDDARYPNLKNDLLVSIGF